MRKQLVSVLVLVATLLLASIQPAGALSNGPAYPQDFPDPSVLVTQGTYWAYSTGSGGRNLQAMQSPDLKTWPQPPTYPIDPLIKENFPNWATPNWTWAPVVVEDSGRYLMYYTVRQVSSGRQCISVATATSPGGPFKDSSTAPLVCQLDHLGSIDPSVFTLTTTNPPTRYLLWKSDDNAIGGQTHLWSQQLSSGGLGLVGRVARLLDQTQSWQQPAIEGPDMIAVGNNYYLFYGAADWNSPTAGIGYAVCNGPLGPCFNQSARGPWLGSRTGALGPSGPSVFKDLSGVTRLAYHAWTNGIVGYDKGGVRALFINQVTFTQNGPVLS